jgi:hypothetical protein
MKIEEIVDFVLKFHNCKRQYEVVESLKNALENLEDERKVLRKFNLPKQCLHDIDIIQLEHGKMSKSERESYLRNLPCMAHFSVSTDRRETNFELNHILSTAQADEFLIVIFPSYWKLTMFEQIRVIIHEARHIVDYPQILKPNKDLDYSLLKEFLKTKNPLEVKAILKKEVRDLNLNPNLLS